MNVNKITILGGGAFGTALANIAADSGVSMVQWMRDADQVAQIQAEGENAKYLPGLPLSTNLQVTSDLSAAMEGTDLVMVAVPSKAFRPVLQQARLFAQPDTAWVSCTKGVEAEGFRLMSEVMVDELQTSRVGVLSGPNLAREIIQKTPTATVIASKDQRLIEQVQQALGCEYFRVYGSQDPYGVELAGALKNVYAIACGMAAALGVGSNTVAMLITRSLAEMSRLANRLDADPMTFLGLAGVGDLMVTCTSPLSRNYRIGYLLGEGKSLEQAALELNQTAEGINTIATLKAKADELGLYMPIVSGLYDIVVEGADVADILRKGMLRDSASDVEFSGRKEP